MIRQGVALSDKPEPTVESHIVNAHDHSTRNRSDVVRSSLCGCFCCEHIFPAAEVVSWLPSENTALCPYCDIDSVIGSASGIELNREFLRRMNEFWF
jgi:hypothetical protein